MTRAARLRRCLAAGVVCALWSATSFGQGGRGNVAYVATPQVAVDELLRMADVGPSDYLIDLGSGDGRVVITAAKQFGASGLGVDLDRYLVELSNANAREAGVEARVRFLVQNVFDTDLRPATVIYSYLLPELNLRLRPTLLGLKPGTRIATHEYNMGAWQPDAQKAIDVPDKVIGDRGRSYLFLWIVPARLAGRWTSQLALGGSTVSYDFRFGQSFQVVDGTLRIGQRTVELPPFTLHGDRFSFDLDVPIDGVTTHQRFAGRVSGASIDGTVTTGEGAAAREMPWTARQTLRGTLRPGGDESPPSRPPG